MPRHWIPRWPKYMQLWTRCWGLNLSGVGARAMEDRIRFIEHQGKRILLIDVSHCSAAELARIAQIVPSYVESEPLGSVLLLADFTGAEFDRIAIDRLKESAVFDRTHLKKSAWFGVEKLPKVFYIHFKIFSREEFPTFTTREESLHWLVEEE